MTTTLPDEVPSYLDGSNTGSNQWYYYDRLLWHNGKETHFPDLPSFDELRTGQRVGIQITQNGSLNLFLDGHYLKTVATGLPVQQAIFGVVDVFGNCTKIKSDILSGELDGVCMGVCGILHVPFETD